MFSFDRQLNKQAWLFHRGEWSQIRNPLYGAHLHDTPPISRRQILGEYNRKYWHLGPTSPLPGYMGTRVAIYAYNGVQNAPAYLIWIESSGPIESIYALDFPDLVGVLELLAPVVLIGFLVDAYQRGNNGL